MRIATEQARGLDPVARVQVGPIVYRIVHRPKQGSTFAGSAGVAGCNFRLLTRRSNTSPRGPVEQSSTRGTCVGGSEPGESWGPMTTGLVAVGPAGRAEKTFTVYRTPHGPIVRTLNDKWVAIALMQEPVAVASPISM